MQQAIQTKLLPATNTKGARVKATCSRGSIIVPYNQGSPLHGPHRLAARALIRKFVEEDERRGIPAMDNPWLWPIASGWLPDGTDVHVFFEPR